MCVCLTDTVCNQTAVWLWFNVSCVCVCVCVCLTDTVCNQTAVWLWFNVSCVCVCVCVFDRYCM